MKFIYKRSRKGSLLMLFIKVIHRALYANMQVKENQSGSNSNGMY